MRSRIHPSPILIDANVPIYASGRPHPVQQPCVRVLELAAILPQWFVTDAEVSRSSYTGTSPFGCGRKPEARSSDSWR